ncbi:MAG: hypothetical protein E7290_02070 [Lachnospiraceae bacterium]|nr:hypothetical protein [Lachnospiraceae bacterium]
MGRPSKPFSVISTEGKSHRTKAEMEQRKKAEEELLTGVSLKERKEVRENDRAHKEFMKVNKLLKKINKNDALFEGVINRYCMLVAECEEFEQKRESFYQRAQKFEEKESQLIESGMSYAEYYKMLGSFQSQVTAIDKQLQAKRKMLMDIEKENLMTISGGLRSIPKKTNENEEDPLKKILGNGS